MATKKKLKAVTQTAPRTRAKKPRWLSSSDPAVRRKGFETMMETWHDFCKVPIGYIDEVDLKRLLQHEMKHKKRWAIVNRLHSALSSRQTMRERQRLKERCLKP